MNDGAIATEKPVVAARESEARPSRRDRRLTRPDAWRLGALLLVLLVSRGLMIASSVGELHLFFPNVAQQFQLSDRLLSPTSSATLFHELFSNANYYLPQGRQFHGLLYWNNILVYLTGLILGFHYANAHVVALGYHALAFVCWSLLALRVAGRRAMFIFAVLFIVAPRGMIEAGLFLQGSHAEAQALFGLAFLLAFNGNKRAVLTGSSPFRRFDGVDLLFLLFVPLAWLSKAILLFAPFAVVALWLKGREDRPGARFYATRAALLLMLGSLPAVWFFARYGFYAHYVADGAAHVDGPSLWTVFRTPQWDAAAFQLPPWNLDDPWSLRGARVILVLWAVSIPSAVVAAWKARGEAGARALWAVAALIAVPALFGATVFFSSIAILERYFYPLYPFVPVLIAVALAEWRRPLALAVVVLWVVMCGSAQRDFIRFDRLDMFRNYDGLRYAEAGIFYVPRRDVDWVNAWLAGCPTLASPGLIFWNSLTGALATEISTRGLDEYAIKDFPARLSFAAAASPPWEDEWRALGGALGLKLRADRAAFERLLRDARLKSPTGDWMREGFAATESRGVAGLCPADPPEMLRDDFKATVLEGRWSRRAVP